MIGADLALKEQRGVFHLCAHPLELSWAHIVE